MVINKSRNVSIYHHICTEVCVHVCVCVCGGGGGGGDGGNYTTSALRVASLAGMHRQFP